MTLRKTVAELFFEGDIKKTKNVLDRLRLKDGLVASTGEGLSGQLTYYHLTKKAAEFYPVKPCFFKPLRPGPITQCLAVLWWCCMEETKRSLLTENEIPDFLTGLELTADFAVDSVEDKIYRIHITDPLRTTAKTLAKRLAQEVFSTNSGVLKELQERGAYRLAVLTQSSASARVLEHHFYELGLRNCVDCFVVPSPATLKEVYHDFKNSRVS